MHTYMNKMIRIVGVCAWMLLALPVMAQKIDEERMTRDIAVAENVLSTLLRQKNEGKGSFYFSEVSGNYRPGYGVIFSVPFNEWTYISVPTTINRQGDNFVVTWDSDTRVGVAGRAEATNMKRLKARSDEEQDSLRTAAKERYLDAMKTFLADYGDMISQLGNDEKIMITNRPAGMGGIDFGPKSRRTLLSAEIAKSDMIQFKQGKLNREQLLKKIKVTNAESNPEVETDLELFASIFNRLYRMDLSKTYFMEGELYYERLNNYGAVYYMQVFSSNRDGDATYSMPTINLEELSEGERNKKVKELYPAFEKDIRENLVEYGRTVRSLKPDEQLAIIIQITRCVECGIPSTLELAVKGSVLADYASGKLSKEQAVNAVTVRKGPAQ